jgi:hypothetical protein
MTYGELGRTPIDICIKLRIVNFWNRLISNEKKLSYFYRTEGEVFLVA